MRQFSKPPVGASISVTTRYKESSIHVDNEWRDTIHTGRVLPDEPWFTKNEFKLTCDESHIPFRVINLSNVDELKVNGQNADLEDVEDGTKVVEMKGSKGAQYWVTIKDGSSVSCTCPGFIFRQRCRHLTEAVATVDSNPKVEDSDAGSKPNVTFHKRGKTMSKSKTMSWNDRFALIDHYKPTDTVACEAFGVTKDELKTAIEMRTAGAFTATPDIDVKSYASLFAADDKTTTKSRVSATSTKRDTTDDKPTTATKKVAAKKKRGRKGDKIANAFAAIPTKATPVEAFAKQHGVSVAVLRQSKRFNRSPEQGTIRVKKDKGSKTLMIWREAVASK